MAGSSGGEAVEESSRPRLIVVASASSPCVEEGDTFAFLERGTLVKGFKTATGAAITTVGA